MLARIAAWYVCVHWLAAQLSKNDLRAVEAWGLAPRGWLYWLLSSRPSAAEAFGRGKTIEQLGGFVKQILHTVRSIVANLPQMAAPRGAWTVACLEV